MAASQYAHIIIANEPLMLMERCDQLLKEMMAGAAAERQVVDASTQVQWDELIGAQSGLSLFAEAKVLDIRFNKAPDASAQKALVELLTNASAEAAVLCRFLISAGSPGGKWLNKLRSLARVEVLKMPEGAQFASWLSQRIKRQSLNLEPQAVQRLLELTEGNLLAAEQALQKLSLLFADKLIGEVELEQVVTDFSRFKTFSCIDAARAGDWQRAVRAMAKIRADESTPLLLVNLLWPEVEVCIVLAEQQRRGQSTQSVWPHFGHIWNTRQRQLEQAAKRWGPRIWQRLLQRLADIDKMVKGQAEGDPWQEMESCLRVFSGQNIWKQLHQAESS